MPLLKRKSLISYYLINALRCNIRIIVKKSTNRCPNVRGTAPRSMSKSVRVATHLPVLQGCIDVKYPTHIIEHGMGISSTPFFHTLNLNTLLSFENEPRWQICRSCTQDKSFNHIIVTYDNDDAVLALLQQHITPATTIALLDGPGPERIALLKIAQIINVPYIVEHDSETHVTQEIQSRSELCKTHEYSALYYVGMNPETIVYVKNGYEFTRTSDYVDAP